MPKNIEHKSPHRFSMIVSFCLCSALYALMVIGYNYASAHFKTAGEAQKIYLLSLQYFNNDAGEDSKAIDKKQKDKSKTLKSKKAQSKTLSKKLASKDETLLESAQESAINQTQSVQSRSSNVAEVDSYMKYVYTLIAKASMRQSVLKHTTTKGEVSLIFSIDMQGGIHDIHIHKRSQDSHIDEVAISTIKSIEKELKKPSKEYTMSVTLGIGNNKR
ncbi:hypothetical protein OQH61_03520 [Helicobacter sp. MIT 21-1697]|uniref:hypothetical protein n=1 Tax=Helicobacter sp. MIT 21-1697 TaxID=2993733 RepID=UPI00224AD2BB|nr:hypothetical protein [Helicobacter sp. MIT 21-1697]MCX2716803.1 hypothetical protein [Helicobacter sp. MIT 21-1697]